MIMDLPGQDHFVWLVPVDQRTQLRFYGVGAAHGGDPQGLIDGLPHLCANLGIYIIYRTGQFSRISG